MTKLALAFVVLATACTFAPANDATTDAGTTNGGDGDAGAFDADAAAVAPPDATPTLITLRQTTTDTPASGHSDQCLTSGGTHAETYARLFPLAFAFHVVRVDFSSDATNASGIAVRVGVYSGSISSPTLDPAAISWVATAAANVADGQNLSSAAIGADMVAGATMIVAVESPDYTNGSRFLVDGATGSETGPSYWRADDCETPELAQHDGRDNADVGTFVIDAIGYVQ
jgi:hypothetical protein